MSSNQHLAPWTPADDAVLRKLYPAGSWKAVAAALPGRTMYGIKSRAKLLRVYIRFDLRPHAPPPEPHPAREWTDEETADLLVLAQTMTFGEIGDKLGRSPRSVRSKLRRLGWSREEPVVVVERLAQPDRAPRYPSVWGYAQGVQA